MSALISECGEYRYWLRRDELLPSGNGNVLFVLLNPSKADASTDDKTLVKCMNYARRWGYDSLTIANLYSYRSTAPTFLWQHEDPVGPNNDEWLKQLVVGRELVVCGWGDNARQQRVVEVCLLMKEAGVELHCLGTTKAGAPKHPLFIKSDQALEEWVKLT